ncbi:LysR family transcriptional regulator [Mangrovicoccus ximenensis]|uniref:LysR family transcriptional regulator n=1 Tax=Mangrovicoccus ximenensis TaxID=1911570 RepID=UPI000D369ADA|nr:LysR family transcriptional regulator [Mangrovicoccus ximenensis]
MDAWDEIRTAYHVARLGTVSGAAEVLGVHHATVIRHIDSLEKRLGTKLFQRHARGYTATEAGQDLMQVAQATDDQFTQLASRLKGRGDSVTGELVVTSIESLSPLLSPALAEFQMANPGVTVRYVTGDRVFRLEYGEAHVAIRAGNAPNEPDNVVQRYATAQVALYASRSYLGDRALPIPEEELPQQKFVGYENMDSRAPFYRWMEDSVPRQNIVMRGSDGRSVKHAIRTGIGLGFMQSWEASQYDDLVQVVEPKSDWAAPLWLVTHVDLHRTAKVQAILAHLKAAAESWTLS